MPQEFRGLTSVQVFGPIKPSLLPLPLEHWENTSVSCGNTWPPMEPSRLILWHPYPVKVLKWFSSQTAVTRCLCVPLIPTL